MLKIDVSSSVDMIFTATVRVPCSVWSMLWPLSVRYQVLTVEYATAILFLTVGVCDIAISTALCCPLGARYYFLCGKLLSVGCATSLIPQHCFYGCMCDIALYGSLWLPRQCVLAVEYAISVSLPPSC